MTLIFNVSVFVFRVQKCNNTESCETCLADSIPVFSLFSLGRIGPRLPQARPEERGLRLQSSLRQIL